MSWPLSDDQRLELLERMHLDAMHDGDWEVAAVYGRALRRAWGCPPFDEHSLHIVCRCGERFDSLTLANQHIFDCWKVVQ